MKAYGYLNSLEINGIQVKKIIIFIQENAFENVSKMPSILFWPLCVKVLGFKMSPILFWLVCVKLLGYSVWYIDRLCFHNPNMLFSEVLTESNSVGKSGILLCMVPTNERRRYIVMSSLIGWAHTQKDPWVDAYKYFSPDHTGKNLNSLCPRDLSYAYFYVFCIHVYYMRRTLGGKLFAHTLFYKD